ncbi:MAG: 4-hydroxy-tetrahydrodipicolinate synthase [Firmicutes bacterium]|nr:4-hydroxy-tetrahydrodipicolinate synthase [Bacillota bacterium]MBQ3612304.1 4-hydroxy-tetrahydrodipicolinate synthase [Bacillota bacterium]MBR1993492.1 4-hydroxy-tetrahydrodipicolinate synthase [Bacillota bacterium]MBR3788012.1 4-hydroxy-tetrahydrodipicolinate synthase [Bacillota bacterium]
MIKGSMVALVTPFTEDGSVNFKRVRELVEWHIQEGTDAILVLGTTAETPTLTTEEEDEIVRIAIEQNAGRVPIVVGSGSNNTAKAIETSLKYEKMGADALLVISPYYNKANKQGMIQHFLAVADAVNTPIILYNVPARTGISISYEVLEAVCKHKNIVGIKEASGDMSLVSKFSKLIDDNFTIYSGNDDINVPLMSLGGGGVISVLANILPGVSHDMAAAALEGDFVKAREIQIKYMDLINALFIETNPIPVKEAMNMLGLEAGGYRLPLYPMEEKNRAVLKGELEKLGLL